MLCVVQSSPLVCRDGWLYLELTPIVGLECGPLIGGMIFGRLFVQGRPRLSGVGC
jgi:hypothetical protein